MDGDDDGGGGCMHGKKNSFYWGGVKGGRWLSIASFTSSLQHFDAQITVIVKISRTISSPTRFHPLSSHLSWKKNHKVTHSIFVSEKKNRFGIALEITLEKEIGFKLIFVIQIQSLAGSFFE